MAAVSIILLFIILIVYYKTIFLLGLFSVYPHPLNDIVSMYLPFRNFFAETIRCGQFPLWTPDIYLGFPLHAEGQGSFLYPPNILFAILPSWIAYNYVFILHIFFSGFFTYLFARTIGLRKSASILASIVFAFSGFSAAHNEHMNLLNAVSWIPLLFLFTYKISHKKLSLFLGLIFAFQFLTGFPQIAYYSIIVGFLWLIFINLNIKPVLKFFLATLSGILISLCQLLPTIELIPYSHRVAGVVKEELLSWGYYIKDLLFFIVPYIFGDPALGTYTRKDSIFYENCAYLGIITLLIALVGVVKNFKKDKKIRFFSLLILILISVILSFQYLYPLFLQIPGFKYFRIPQRLLVFVVFSLAILSAKGLEIFPKLKFLIGAIICIELVNFSFGYNTIITPRYFSKPETVKFLDKDKDLFRVYSYDPGEHAWIYAYCFIHVPEYTEVVQHHFRNYLYPNTNMYYHISSLDVYTPFIRRQELKNLELANVKYVISSSDISEKPNFLLIKKMNFNIPLPELRIYKNTNFLPRAFIIKSEKIILPVKILKYNPTKIVIENEQNNEGELLLCDFYYPGWEAFVDGKKRGIIPFEGIRKLKVLKNEQKIVFVYKPASFFVGVLVSIVSIFILSGLLIYEKNSCY